MAHVRFTELSACLGSIHMVGLPISPRYPRCKVLDLQPSTAKPTRSHPTPAMLYLEGVRKIILCNTFLLTIFVHPGSIA